MRVNFLACFMLLSFLLQAQVVRRTETSAVTIRGNMGIPKPISSARFYQSFTGVFEGNLSVGFRVAKDLSAGLGYQATAFRNNDLFKQKIYNAELPYKTSLDCHGGFVRLGYDQFWKQNSFVSYALNAGYTAGKYNNVNPDSSFHNRPLIDREFRTPFIQGECGVNWVMEQRLAFSLFVSYTTYFMRFDARAPRFNQFEEIRKKTNNYVISYFNFGFGFTVLLGK